MNWEPFDADADDDDDDDYDELDVLFLTGDAERVDDDADHADYDYDDRMAHAAADRAAERAAKWNEW